MNTAMSVVDRQQRILLSLRGEVHLGRSKAEMVGGADLSSQRDGGELVTQADTEEGRTCPHRPGDELAGGREPRSLSIVLAAHGTAQHHECVSVHNRRHRMVPGVHLDDVCPGVAPKLPESAWAAGGLVNDDQDLRHGETLRAFCHGRMPELLQLGYRFRPTGRQLLLLRDGQVGLLSIFAHDLPGGGWVVRNHGIDGAGNGVDTLEHMILLTALSVLAITVPTIVFIFALLSILRSDRLTGTGKVIWIVVCFCFPLVGPIVWFIAGKSTALN